MSKTFKIVFFTALFLMAPLFMQLGICQPPPPTGPPCWPPPCMPIDGGISFLLIAGAAYGGKKVYEAYRK